MHHSYEQYLAQQYLKENMNVVVAKNVREAVGSIEDIYKHNTERITAGLTDIQCRMDRTNDHLEEISFALDGIQGTLDVVNSNVVSGFQALFVKTDELNESLTHIGYGIDAIGQGINTLVQIGRAPVQTWASNQYEIARDAIRRELFPEALEALDYAISGNGQNTGHKTDYRFHHLRGVLLLGIAGEPESLPLVNLKAAESAFVQAARYAQHDNPGEAAQALVGAGKATYAEARLPDAQKYFLMSLKCDPRCGEANYQLARLYVHANDMNAIQRYLSTAFDVHWSFAMRAAEDAQFSHMTDTVENCVHLATQRMIQEIQPPVRKIVDDLKFVKEKEIELCPISGINEHAAILEDIADARNALNIKKLKNVFDVRHNMPRTREKVQKLAVSYCGHLTSSESRISSEGANFSARYIDPDRLAKSLKIAVRVIVIMAAVWWWATWKADVWHTHQPIEYVIGILVFIAAAVLLGNLSFSLGKSMTKASNETRTNRARARNQKVSEENRAHLLRTINDIRAHFQI
jgi:tetratricopeptide (TPR) repeat protein